MSRGSLRRNHELVVLLAVVHVMAVVLPNRAEAQASNPRNEQPPVLDTERHSWSRVIIERCADNRKVFDRRLAAQGAATYPLFATHPDHVIGE